MAGVRIDPVAAEVGRGLGAGEMNQGQEQAGNSFEGGRGGAG